MCILDFIDRNSAQCDITDLRVHPYIFPAAEPESEPLKPLGSSVQGYRPAADLYLLSSGYQYEIRDSYGLRLKGIALINKNRATGLEPHL